MAAPAFDSETLAIGIVGRPHGLSGELTLHPHNASAGALSAAVVKRAVRELWFERAGVRQRCPVESLRRTGPGWLFRLPDVTSREAAHAWTNAEVRIDRACLPPLGPGEFFVEDLLGCTVTELATGKTLGAVDSLFWNGAQDIMVVRRSGGGADEIMIPVVPVFVLAVDTLGRRVSVEWNDETDELLPRANEGKRDGAGGAKRRRRPRGAPPNRKKDEP